MFLRPTPNGIRGVGPISVACVGPTENHGTLRVVGAFDPANSFGVVVDQVVTHFEPYRRVGFISHFAGVTMISQVFFCALGDDVIEVRSNLEFVGSFSRVAGLAPGPAIEYGARMFHEFLKQECEKEIPSEVSPGRSEAR